jgi:hypothetical protein
LNLTLRYCSAFALEKSGTLEIMFESKHRTSKEDGNADSLVMALP